jgi:Ca2+-binding EF-hand superfamily protein
VIKAYFIGGAIAALVVASTAVAAQTTPPPGVAQGTAPAPMAARPPLPPVPPMPPMAAPPMIMMKMDSNHAMTRDEVVKHVRELFARLDTNRDGFITKDEIEAFHQKFAGMAQMGHDMAEHAHGMAELGREMAERHADDGMPMPDRGAMFDRLDTNHDGVISRAEFMARRPEVREKRVMIMRSADATPEAAMAPPMDGHPQMKMEMHMRHMGGTGGMGGMGGMGMHLFEMADANHDGRVSLAEAEAAALAHFDKADLNHDGKISPDEHQQIREQIRIEHRPS